MQEFREDTSYFVDDDERVLDETTMALSLLAGPPNLNPEMSDFTRTLCYIGIIFSAFLTIATCISLHSWLAWSNLLLLAFQLILVIGIWIVLLTYCVVKALSDNRTRLANEVAVEEYEEIRQQYFNELNASKRDARMRKNKALETELRLRETRVQPDPIGNYAALRDPVSGQVLMLPSGNYQQPVPNTFHYHSVVPGSVQVSEEKPKGLPAPEFPAPVKFEEILRGGFTPTPQNIHLLSTVNGSLNESMSEVCHVGLASRTGGGKCLEENEAIFLADGRVLPARALVGKMVEVVGVTDTQTMQQVPVAASFSDNGVRTVIEIVLDNGVTLKRTEDHPLWAAHLNDDQHVGLFRSDGNKDTRTRAIQAGWVAAKDIRVCGSRPNFDGHILLCPTSLQQQGTLRRPEEDIILCAVLLAEGGLTRPSTVRFTSAVPQIVAAMSKAAEASGCEIIPIPVKGKTSVIDYRISRSHIGNENKINLLIQEWGLSGCSALQKQVPQWVFQLPNDQIALFLRMFFDCDGWIDDGHHSYPRISICLANPILVRQIGQLALRLGITGTYRAKTNNHAGSWIWSTPLVDTWQRVIGSTIKAEKLASAVASKHARDTSAKTDWNAWRQARPSGDQTFADCPPGYEWRKVVAIRSSVAPTVSTEVHNDNHAFVSHVVEHNTNTTRLLTGQFIHAGARVYLASPNFAQLKLNKNHLEDWRPIVQHLAAPPAQSDAEIRTLLLQFRQLFERRKAVEQRTARRGEDVFLILGEWPGIVKRVKEAPEILELLLRESRQYGIHIVTEFQDALVKTLGLDSGVRENLLHCYYFGGDPITAKIVLDLAKGVSLNETGLGKFGAAYMRANEKEIVAGRVPHLTNRALYMLLGTPPDPVTDDEIFDESQIPETYSHVDENGQYIDGGAIVDYDSQPPAQQRSFHMPGNRRTVDAAAERDVRPGAGRSQGTSYARTETRQDDQESPDLDEVEENESAHQNVGRQPLDGAHTTQPERAALRYRLGDLQVELFATAYQITGNIDESLDHAGANTRYREHAREIIRERSLRKRDS